MADEGGKYMLNSGARMDIVGVHLETKNLVLRKREKIQKKIHLSLGLNQESLLPHLQMHAFS